MHAGPVDLGDLERAPRDRPAWFLDLVDPDVSPGRVHPRFFDAIEASPEVVAVRVYGLSQAGFEELMTRCGERLEAVDLWKCPRLADLSPFEAAPRLRVVSIYWNQRATRHWDVTRTPDLSSLRLWDFTRLHQLDDLASSSSLRELDFGDVIWPKSTYETLEPLRGLHRLRELSVHPRRIDDGRIQPLAALSGLRELAVPTNLFSTEQFAWLTAHMPDTVTSNVLSAVVPRDWSGNDASSIDVVLVGKGKPILRADRDAARIAKHVAAFESLVSRFKSYPDLEPAPTTTRARKPSAQESARDEAG
jgi:hypothetical protein